MYEFSFWLCLILGTIVWFAACINFKQKQTAFGVLCILATIVLFAGALFSVTNVK